jgi:hypothetical protein
MTMLPFAVIMSGPYSRFIAPGKPGVYKRSAQQRFVAWLAVAAMALIVLMPVVSRSMPMDDAMMGMMGATSAMHDGHAHAHHHHAGMPGHPDDPTARCGYCVLLSHTPAAGFSLPVVVPPVFAAAPAPYVALPPIASTAPQLSAQPRGPPLLGNG